jgi:hypothetical protein
VKRAGGAHRLRRGGSHPEGFEWCINQPAIDATGVAFGNSEDGSLYSLERDGSRRQVLFLDAALGAAYTPVAIGPDGVVYAQNFGRLFAVGAAPIVPEPRRAPTQVPEGRPSARTVVR